MPFCLPTYSLSLTSPIQRDTETLSIMPAIIPTAIQPNLGPAHSSTHPSIVDQLRATQSALNNKILAMSGVNSQGKTEKASSSSTLSSRGGPPHLPNVQNPPNTSPLTNGAEEPYESDPSFSQTIRQAVQQLFLIISKMESQAIPKVASCNVNPTSVTQQGEGAESSHLQTSSRASSPSVQSVDSAADDTNLSSLSLFVAPTDSQLATEATMSSPAHQTGEVTSRSETDSQGNGGDLQEALVLLARGKEEAETTILELRKKVDELERELVIAQTEVQRVRENHIQQQQALER